jgi:GT2 family glycosyltransferase
MTDFAVDVLIPTFERPAALAVLLTSLAAQTRTDLRIVVADQSHGVPSFAAAEVRAAVSVLELRGAAVELDRNLPRRGLAQQRQFLLDRAAARYALYLDDDVIVDPDLVERLLATIEEEGCGFVGCGLIGPSYRDDVRPHEQRVEFWEGPVVPEEIRIGTPAWERHRLHNAANLLHLQRRLGLSRADRVRYKVAWVGGCVLYDTAALNAVGGFEFWRALPAGHCGEDVLAQWRVMARYGGCGLLPSAAYHQELPTTVVDRTTDAPVALSLHDDCQRATA